MSGSPPVRPSLCQVAIVTHDVDRSIRFYSELLGLRYVGNIPVRGELAARMFSVPRVQGRNHWLTGAERFFQVELFEFAEPVSRAAPRRRDDLGFQRVTVEVADLTQALSKIGALGGEAIADHQRGEAVDRAWARDPDGVLLELRAPRRGGARPRVLGVSAVVDDLADAQRYFVDCLGLPRWAGDPLPDGAPGPAADERVVLEAGATWLELQWYRSRPAPAQRPLLTDRGFMNIALGMRRGAEFDELYQRVVAQARRCATDPIGGAFGHMVYTEPMSSISVELLQLPAFLDSLWGFKAPGPLAAAGQRMLRFMLERQRQPAAGAEGPEGAAGAKGAKGA